MTDPYAKHRATIHNRLLDIARQSARCDAADEAIRKAAEQRLAKVEQLIKELRPKALADDKAGEQYQALILERGQLRQVLSTE